MKPSPTISLIPLDVAKYYLTHYGEYEITNCLGKGKLIIRDLRFISNKKGSD